MKLPIIAMAFILFSAGVITANLVPPTPSSEPPSDVLSETTSNESSFPSPSALPIQTTNPSLVTPSPSTVPSSTTPSPQIDKWSYPGSQVVNQQSLQTTYQSTDEPTRITDWYKEKIIAAGMNIKTFVQTKTNGKVKNVLSGAGNGEVKIEITKDPEDTKTTILITPQS